MPQGRENVASHRDAAARPSTASGRAARGPSVQFDMPDKYRSLDDDYGQAPLSQHKVPSQQAQAQAQTRRSRSSASGTHHRVPDSYMNVPESSAISPVHSNRNERSMYESDSLEEERPGHQTSMNHVRPHGSDEKKAGQADEVTVSRLATEVYTVSYLILFSIFGTLARLGLQALTYYPGAPVALSVLWPNFAGSLIMGFLAEDRMLFRCEWGAPEVGQPQAERQTAEESRPDPERAAVDLAAARKAHLATKKTIPLYIGLATGFCGSFTSFSSFIRDVFLALSNDLPLADTGSTTVPRDGGYSFMALLAVIITTVSLSLSGLFVGAHIAVALEPVTPSLPYVFVRKVVDRFAVFLAWGAWVGAIVLSAIPPDRSTNPGASEVWRGRATFALVFAPLGCLARFYVSLYLNGQLASFPLGTFAVNVGGTALLGMAWDLAHVPEGGVIGCQVLQGIEDGFCGCLTTVSTLVAELAALRRRHAYIYGGASVVAALACMVAIMGGLRWSDGFAGLVCLH
ncbi:Uu.00g079940.m01.CDS01 [Anthostomella pinea]|uniref:Uu.00g079940.m01.CDS01 n=1 Tax=Anthostomella pinea TaxID=933095 RepID=A0AAI8VKZ5_9PEZI|nr:Uu.00g079940.m01.CDS01 [Anthostomella pinea]